MFAFAGSGISEVRSYYAYDAAFAGGVSVAVGRFDASGHDPVVTGVGPGGGPHVKAFDVASGTVSEARSFLAFDGAFSGGVSVTAGNGLIVVGAGAGGDSHVAAFRYGDGAESLSFDAYEGFEGAGGWP